MTRPIVTAILLLLLVVLSASAYEDYGEDPTSTPNPPSNESTLYSWSQYITAPVALTIIQFYAFGIFYHMCFERNGSRSGVLPQFGMLLNMSVISALANSLAITWFITAEKNYWLFVSTFVMSQPFIVIPHFAIAFCQWGPCYLKAASEKFIHPVPFLMILARQAPNPRRPGLGFLRLLLILFVPIFIFIIVVVSVFYHRYSSVGYEGFFDMHPSQGDQSAFVGILFAYFMTFTIISAALHSQAVVLHSRLVAEGKGRIFSTIFGAQGIIMLVWIFICVMAFMVCFFTTTTVNTALVTMVLGMGPEFIYVVPEALKLVLSTCSCRARSASKSGGGEYGIVGTSNPGDDIQLLNDGEEEGEDNGEIDFSSPAPPADIPTLEDLVYSRGRGSGVEGASSKFMNSTGADCDALFFKIQSTLSTSSGTVHAGNITKVTTRIHSASQKVGELDTMVKKRRSAIKDNQPLRQLVSEIKADTFFGPLTETYQVREDDEGYPHDLLTAMTRALTVATMVAEGVRRLAKNTGGR
jgi:hypothetical protein